MMSDSIEWTRLDFACTTMAAENRTKLKKLCVDLQWFPNHFAKIWDIQVYKYLLKCNVVSN